MTAETDAANTSSIGLAWPPVHSSNERVRGFFPETLSTTEAVEEFVDVFYDERDKVEAKSRGETNRLSLRAVGKVGSVAMLHDAGIHIEGILPLAGDAHGLHLIYAAHNTAGRSLEEDKLDEHKQLLDTVIGRPARPGTTHRLDGFTPHLIDSSTPGSERHQLKSEFVDLYGTFGFDDNEVEELLLNPANVIAYMRSESGRIVSTSLAERASIQLSDREAVSIAEITEAATLPDYRGHGLYTKLSGYLVQRILEQESDLSLLYGESNLASPGVIYAARTNGRQFAYHDRSHYGSDSDSFGILVQNFSVNDGRETRLYNDFALSYVKLD